MVTVFIAAVLALNYSDMSEGERYIYHGMSKRLETIDTKVTRLEVQTDAIKDDMSRQRERASRHEDDIKVLNQFKDEATGRRAVEVSIAALLAGLVMSYVNRKAAMLSKRKGRG